MSSSLRRLPAVHKLMQSQQLRDAIDLYGRDLVRDACRRVLDDLRKRVRAGEDVEQPSSRALREVRDVLETDMRSAYRRVINATGVVLHTNLGRAPLNIEQEASYLTLEYDLESGQRGQRLAPLRRRLAATCGAEWAVMVNNNAASLLLILNALARDREVLVSRSQLIEIGGSFRLPAVMEAAGARLVEVGCTNRTHITDYAQTIGDETAAILVAHQSNFRIVGFTSNPPLSDLAQLAHEHQIPLIVDQGSGCLHDLSQWGLPHEETVEEILRAGADIVCFSGDKLIGGPQAGIIVGPKTWVEPLGKHPLYRALRPDKTALMAMDSVLVAHQTGKLESIPLYAMMSTPVDRLKRRAARLGRIIRERDIPVHGRQTRSALGGGTTPEETMPSYGLQLDGGQRLADLLRQSTPAVIARIEDDAVVFDLRTVLPEQDNALVDAISEAYKKLQANHSMGT